ncbi:MAG TPA: Gfo/Idh/MocA family oxidoreductase [Candidatus Latescibacteria bacterium]|nr:Gfo/Idh/MocA family oxidoreductase [Candidatus Latescibacterota bacterium]
MRGGEMKLRVIQVGVGGFGRGWVEVLARSEEVEVVGLVDVDQQALEEAGEKLGVDELFTNFEEALGKVEADAVLDVTPPTFRTEITLKALKAGRHVLSEKPLALSMEDAKAIVRAADEAGRVYMVSQNYRFNPVPRTIRELLGERAKGKVEYVVVEFQKGPRFVGFRTEMEYPLLVDMSIHHFDLMRYLLDSDVEWVQVESFRPTWSWFRHDPSFFMVLKMADGTLISYSGSWVTRGFETTWNGRWRFACSEGSLLWDNDKLYLSAGTKGRRKAELVDMPLTNQDYSLHEFVSSIREGREPETSGRDNIRSLAVVFASVLSARTGRRVKVEELFGR